MIMATRLGLPVPPGFTITTAACNSYLAAAGRRPGPKLRADVHRIAGQLGRQFGDPANPLLVSVRSGAPVSMPGMMDTILDLGLNEATAAGLGRVTGNPDFAVDCLRRFRQMYRDIVGCDAPDDPWEQLRGAIEAVFRSWHSDRARAYREHEGIPDDLGTGVTVQAMVFGNMSPDSGTGVLFTRSPATGDRALYGDVMFRAQGEDVVAGTHKPQPLSSLDGRLPEVAAELRRYSDVLERHFADLCDIEFTIERGKLWMLQVQFGKRSPRAALRIAVDMATDPQFPCSRAEAVRRTARYLSSPPREFVRQPGGQTALTAGLPASPGVATGEIATTPEDAERADAAGRQVILVRQEDLAVRRARHGACGRDSYRTGRAGQPCRRCRPRLGHTRSRGCRGDRGVGRAGGDRRTHYALGRAHLHRRQHRRGFCRRSGWPPRDRAGGGHPAGLGTELGIDVGAPADTPVAVVPEQAAAYPVTVADLLQALLIKGSIPADQIASAVSGDPGPGQLAHGRPGH